MKTLTLKLIYFLGAAFLLFGCSGSRYDISDGFNKDITLFSDEISVPVGSIGPVWGVALSVGVHKFHLNACLQNGFGGTVPYTSTQLKANTKCLTLGVTYDI